MLVGPDLAARTIEVTNEFRIEPAFFRDFEVVLNRTPIRLPAHSGVSLTAGDAQSGAAADHAGATDGSFESIPSARKENLGSPRAPAASLARLQMQGAALVEHRLVHDHFSAVIFIAPAAELRGIVRVEFHLWRLDAGQLFRHANAADFDAFPN